MSVLLQFIANASDTINSSAANACGSACNNVGVQTIFRSVANALIYMVGALSVIMIIFGGLRYVISHGDPKQITAAKDTILYAVAGIVVAIAAYSIVNFVTKAF